MESVRNTASMVIRGFHVYLNEHEECNTYLFLSVLSQLCDMYTLHLCESLSMAKLKSKILIMDKLKVTAQNNHLVKY